MNTTFILCSCSIRYHNLKTKADKLCLVSCYNTWASIQSL